MKKDFKEFIPIGILDIIGLFAIIQILTTEYIFTYRQYIGLSLLLVCTILFFVNRKSYKYLLGLTLISGTLSLIAFNNTIIAIGGFAFGLEFQIIPFLILLIYLFIYRIEIRKLFGKTNSEKSNNTDKLKDRFKQRFKELTDKEIENKLTQDLVPEAIKALKEIVNERN